MGCTCNEASRMDCRWLVVDFSSRASGWGRGARERLYIATHITTCCARRAALLIWSIAHVYCACHGRQVQDICDKSIACSSLSHVQVWGRKHVRVYPPEARAKVHPFSRGVLRNTSQVDTQSRDGPAFPGFQEVSFQEVVLRPGEMLYMPPKYWHEVTALEGSMSLSYWWT